MSSRDTATIWRWEHYFQILAEARAKKLLGNLDSTLAPTVHLIGLRSAGEGTESPFEVALVPPDSALGQADFTRVGELARTHLRNDPEGQLRHSNTAAQQNEQLRLGRRALAQAVTDVLKPVDAREGLLSFCGEPVEVSDWDRSHLVLPVVRVSAVALEAHAALTRDWYELHEFRRARIATSLVDAAILVLLRALSDRLRMVAPGDDMNPTEATPDELLGRAGRTLMRTAEAAADPLALEALWTACDALATMPYEGKEPRGRLVIAAAQQPAVEMRVLFDPPVDVSAHRTVRKLLELTSANGQGLVTDGLVVRGLGAIGAGYDEASEECFTVDFLANGVWELRHSARPLMAVSYGRPVIPQARISRPQLSRAIQAVHGTVAAETEERLWKVVGAATQTRHGALLVISREAAQEAARLRPQVIPITPTELDADLARRATAIDGALLVDQDGVCHAIGAILDGVAGGDGDPSRGARFNSAVRYVESRQGACFALVVSEDGMSDLVLPSGSGTAERDEFADRAEPRTVSPL
jgi:DNA integrity scanning protein DisA with diadenylate cyclase activity